jgi:hypothetical protein
LKKLAALLAVRPEKCKKGVAVLIDGNPLFALDGHGTSCTFFFAVASGCQGRYSGERDVPVEEKRRE